MASKSEREQAGRRGPALQVALAEAREALRGQARRNSPDQTVAEEAFQEASIDFLRYYNGPPGRDAVRWLMVAVKRRAWQLGNDQRERTAQIMPRRWEQPDHDPPAVDAEPLEQVERAEEFAAVLAALELLKPDQRTALLLLGFGLSYREIGERQGWTHTKVNRCLAEGRAALRSLMART